MDLVILSLLCVLFAILGARSAILLFFPGTTAARYCGEERRKAEDARLAKRMLKRFNDERAQELEAELGRAALGIRTSHW